MELGSSEVKPGVSPRGVFVLLERTYNPAEP